MQAIKKKYDLYNGLLFTGGPLGLIFSKVLIVSLLGNLIIIAAVIMIYRDKEYRERYLPFFSNWAMLAILSLIVVLSAYSIFLRIGINS